MCEVLLFKNLRSNLATNLTYFTNKNIHFQDWPLPSLEVFAVSGWSHYLSVYQFVRRWQLFFPNLEYSNIQAPAKSIADKRMCKAASKIGTDFDFLFSIFFWWAECKNWIIYFIYFIPTCMRRQRYVKINICVFQAEAEKLLSIPDLYILHNKTKY